MQISELTLPPPEADWVSRTCGRYGELDELEAALTREAAPGSRAPCCAHFRQRVLAKWHLNEHVVIRKVPTCENGATGLLIARLFMQQFVSYGDSRIARHFRMSPWTKSLSHTLAEGSFHTDFNTADLPPATTAIQCLEPDPGTPAFGQMRVARFKDVMHRLRTTHPDSATFVIAEEVTSVSDSSPLGWTGKILAGDLVRFHPEGLLAARRLLGKNSPSLDAHLANIAEAAREVSSPFNLDPGDLLLVSNRRALHQRGACTVRFLQFPMSFEARRVSVFHAYDEPA